MSRESRLSSGATERAALDSMARYRRRTSSPNFVTRAPPPPSPPVSVSTSGRRNAEFIASTSNQARRYDIFISRAAAEIEPVRAMAPSKSALPGPIATTAPMRMRIFGTSARDMGLKKSTPFAQETQSQYSSTLSGIADSPVRRCPVQALRATSRQGQFVDTAKSAVSNQPPAPISLGEAFRYWLKLGFISFGGPTGQIAIMHQDLVERKRWISEKRFLHALNYCMVLPGPEAQQLATYIGWMMHRTWGGVISGGLFVLPSLFILIALTWVYIAFGNVPLVAGLFYGIKPAVTAIVLFAAYRIGSRALRNAEM